MRKAALAPKRLSLRNRGRDLFDRQFRQGRSTTGSSRRAFLMRARKLYWDFAHAAKLAA
jgi:hypothetical protein